MLMPKTALSKIFTGVWVLLPLLISSMVNADTSLVAWSKLDPGGKDNGPAHVMRGIIVNRDSNGKDTFTGQSTLFVVYRGNLPGHLHAFVKFKYSVGDRTAFFHISGDIESPTPEGSVSTTQEPMLFQFAAGGPDILNAWDIEVAFVNDHGQWDSGPDHKNYSFHFGQEKVD